MQRRYIVLKEHPPLSRRTVKPEETHIQKANSLTPDEYVLEADVDGFIVPSEVHSNPTHKIVFMGDSVVESVFCKEELRFPYLTGRFLEQNNNGIRVNSYNAGVSGAHTMHGINLLTNKLRYLRPDIVVVGYGLIDLGAFLLYGEYWKSYEHAYSHVRLFDKKSIKVEKKHCGFELFLREYESSIRLLCSICNSLNIEPILMLNQNIYQQDSNDPYLLELDKNFLIEFGIGLELYAAYLDQIHDVSKKIALELEIGLINIKEYLPKDKSFFYDDIHLNEKGSIEVAKICADVLREYIK